MAFGSFSKSNELLILSFCCACFCCLACWYTRSFVRSCNQIFCFEQISVRQFKTKFFSLLPFCRLNISKPQGSIEVSDDLKILLNFCPLKCHYWKLSKPSGVITYSSAQCWLPSLSLSHYMPLTETACLLCQQTLMGWEHKMTTNTQGLVFACVSHLWLFWQSWCDDGACLSKQLRWERLSPISVTFSGPDATLWHATANSQIGRGGTIDLKGLLAFIQCFLILGHIYSTILYILIMIILFIYASLRGWLMQNVIFISQAAFMVMHSGTAASQAGGCHAEDTKGQRKAKPLWCF